ncbi:MAG: single-stranded DNA-specific exonuclease [Candidatus Thermoplasmatota archaeon]|nr:single-stranded DNA-specific exonuclease [Candidatus Thermoplasmatota archaeon]
MFDSLNGEGLLIHHWDTDGICSACLLLSHLNGRKIKNITPELGNYFLTNEELENCSIFDYIIVADMALPEEQILKISKNAQVFIFDHHLQNEIKQVFHHNPIIKSDKPNDYPSASWIVNDYLKNPVNLFAILGIVGDHERRILKNLKFKEIINKFCVKNNLTFDNLLRMVYLLDSNYKLGYKKSVENTPHILIQIESPSEILNNELWNKNLSILDNEIELQLRQPSDENSKTIFKKISTKYNIISTVTRRIAWESGKNAIVVNTGYFSDKDQIYMRCAKNAEQMIRRGKQLGFKCGGKKEVLGAILPKDKTDDFVKELKDFLNN